MLFLRFEAPSEHLHTLVAQLFSSSSALPSSQPLPARPLRHHASHHSRRRHPSPLEGSPVRRAAVLQLRRPPARALRADPRCTAALAGPVWRRDRCIRGGGAFGYKSSHSCTVCFLMWEVFFFRIRCYYSVWVVWVTSWPATRLPTSARGVGSYSRDQIPARLVSYSPPGIFNSSAGQFVTPNNKFKGNVLRRCRYFSFCCLKPGDLDLLLCGCLLSSPGAGPRPAQYLQATL